MGSGLHSKLHVTMITVFTLMNHLCTATSSSSIYNEVNLQGGAKVNCSMGKN